MVTTMQKPKSFTADRAKANVKRYDQDRLSDRQFYWSTSWRKFRAWFLSLHPVCEFTLPDGNQCNQPATDVDHRTPRVRLPEHRWMVEEECRAGCASCHARYGTKRGRP
jgi:hypothetical protein